MLRCSILLGSTQGGSCAAAGQVVRGGRCLCICGHTRQHVRKTRNASASPHKGAPDAFVQSRRPRSKACVEVAVDRRAGQIRVQEVCEAFECGPVLNPDNLLAQVQGCISMGLGGALTEEIEFEKGKLLNAAFSRYRVPRFRDLPKIDVHLLNRTDIPSAGGGETPIIAVAPAIGNAVFAATGVRLRSMPMRGEALKKS